MRGKRAERTTLLRKAEGKKMRVNKTRYLLESTGADSG